MRVQNPNSSTVQGSEASRSTQKTDKKDLETKTKGNSDTQSASSEISTLAREMAQAKEVAAAAPSVREEKIAELKRRIANKEYNVKPDAIAAKMVDEHLRELD